MFNYFWERERESASRGGAEKEGDTESKAGSRLWAFSTEPDAELELTSHEIMTWAKVRRSADWATQAPPGRFLKNVQLLKSPSCFPSHICPCFTKSDRKKLCSLTKLGFQSTGINNVAPQWGNVDHIMLASDEGHRLGAAGLVSTQPWFETC